MTPFPQTVNVRLCCERLPQSLRIWDRFSVHGAALLKLSVVTWMNMGLASGSAVLGRTGPERRTFYNQETGQGTLGRAFLGVYLTTAIAITALLPHISLLQPCPPKANSRGSMLWHCSLALSVLHTSSISSKSLLRSA